MDIQELVKPIVFQLKDNPEKTMSIGYHPAINGPDAKPLEGVMPTKDEIRAIVRHHARLIRSVDEEFASDQSSSWSIRQLPYSNFRVNYYQQFLGEEEITDIFNEIYEGFTPDLLEEEMHKIRSGE